MGKYKLIVNPVSGKGKAKAKSPLVNQILTEYGLDFDLFYTEYIGHARELARASVDEKYQTVIAMGGDGTVNEIINGLMEMKLKGKTLPLLAVIPAGRGNDFVYGVNIPPDLREACRIIREGKSYAMDVGRVKGGYYPEGRYFGNGIGLGFDTIVGLEAAKLKGIRGALGYIIGALKTLISFPDPPQLEIDCSDEIITRKATQVSIMNGKRMGGVFFMAPVADYQDGVFDLLITGCLSRKEMIQIIPMITKGIACRHPKASCRQASVIHIKSPEGGIVCHADGETICTDGKELEVECLRGQIRIISRAQA